MTEKMTMDVLVQMLLEAGYQKLSVPGQMGMQAQSEGTRLLESVLRRQLTLINSVEINSVREERFSSQGIEAGIRALKELALLKERSVMRKRSYELLTRGKVFSQYVAGDEVNYTMQYIDWQNPMRNVFHVAEEMRINGRNRSYCPDLILFVNGIPVCVVEIKEKTGYGNEQLAAQQLKAELNSETGVVLDASVQLWVTLVNGRISYTAGGTGDYPWAEWKGEEVGFSRSVFWHPRTLLNLISQFIVFRGENKMVARYFQYVAVQRTLQRIKSVENGKRLGGIIAQPPGSGKTGTMALLTRAILMERSVRNPGILLVTDRKVALEEIGNAFAGLEIPFVTGEEAYKLAVFQDSEKSVVTAITTQCILVNELIFKKSVADRDIFILFDEAGNLKSGKARRQLQQVFPDACYIAMTSLPKLGTVPAMRNFGEVVMRYTMEAAIADNLILPVFYESRSFAEAGQSPEGQSVVKMNAGNLPEASIEAVAKDITGHFLRHFKGTLYKGMLVCASQDEARSFKRFFDREGKLEVGLLIAGVRNEANTEIETIPRIPEWELIRRFREEQRPRLLITVKRYMELDIPRCAVAYVLHSVKAYEFWQIVGRINRRWNEKRYGMLVNYADLPDEIGEVVNENKTEKGILIPEATAFRLLDHYNVVVWDCLGGLTRKNGIEEWEVRLRGEEKRAEFYNRLKNYANCLDIVWTSWIAEKRGAGLDKGYSADLKIFLSLQRALQRRFAEEIKDSTYEDILQHLVAGGVIPYELALSPELVEITERERFDRELEGNELAVADTIFYRTQKYIRQHKEHAGLSSPVILEKLKEIQLIFEKEGEAGQYLIAVKELMEYVRTFGKTEFPAELKGKSVLRRYYKIVVKLMQPTTDPVKMEQRALEIVHGIEEIVHHNIMDGEVVLVDWQLKGSVCGNLSMELEDYLFTRLKQEFEIPLTGKVVEDSVALIIGATIGQSDK